MVYVEIKELTIYNVIHNFIDVLMLPEPFDQHEAE